MRAAFAILLLAFSLQPSAFAVRHAGGPRDSAALKEAVDYQFATPVDWFLIGTNTATAENVSEKHMTNSFVTLSQGRFESTDAMGGNPNTNIVVNTAARIGFSKPYRVGRRIIRQTISGFELRSTNGPAGSYISGFNPKILYYPNGSSPMTVSNMVIGGVITISNMPSPVFGNFDFSEVTDQPASSWAVMQQNINGNPNTTGMGYRSHSSGTPSAGSLVSVTNNVSYYFNFVADLHAKAVRVRYWKLSNGLDLGASVHSPNFGGNPIYAIFMLFNDDHNLNPDGFVLCYNGLFGIYNSTNWVPPQ